MKYGLILWLWCFLSEPAESNCKANMAVHVNKFNKDKISIIRPVEKRKPVCAHRISWE